MWWPKKGSPRFFFFNFSTQIWFSSSTIRCMGYRICHEWDYLASWVTLKGVSRVHPLCVNNNSNALDRQLPFLQFCLSVSSHYSPHHTITITTQMASIPQDRGCFSPFFKRFLHLVSVCKFLFGSATPKTSLEERL